MMMMMMLMLMCQRGHHGLFSLNSLVGPEAAAQAKAGELGKAGACHKIPRQVTHR